MSVNKKTPVSLCSYKKNEFSDLARALSEDFNNPDLKMKTRLSRLASHSSSIIATGLVQPALAPLIFTGKTATLNP